MAWQRVTHEPQPLSKVADMIKNQLEKEERIMELNDAAKKSLIRFSRKAFKADCNIFSYNQIIEVFLYVIPSKKNMLRAINATPSIKRFKKVLCSANQYGWQDAIIRIRTAGNLWQVE